MTGKIMPLRERDTSTVQAASGLRVLDVRGLCGLVWPFSAVHDSQCGAPGRVAGTRTPAAAPAVPAVRQPSGP